MKLADVLADLSAFGFAPAEVTDRLGAGPSAYNAWVALQAELLLRYEALPPALRAELAACHQRLQSLQLRGVTRASDAPLEVATLSPGADQPLPAWYGRVQVYDQTSFGTCLSVLIPRLDDDAQQSLVRSCQLGAFMGSHGRVALQLDVADLLAALPRLAVPTRCFHCHAHVPLVRRYACDRCTWDYLPVCPQCDDLPGTTLLTLGLRELQNHSRTTLSHRP